MYVQGSIPGVNNGFFFFCFIKYKNNSLDTSGHGLSEVQQADVRVDNEKPVPTPS